MATRNRKVLLAEHDKNIVDILTYLLKAWDYEVVTATDGLSVLGTVRREQPDIIIVDFNLPEMDGLQLSKALKEDFLTAHIPVVILIDKKRIRKKMLELEQGVDDYIVNPPDPIDLEVRMEMALRRITHQLHANALTRLPGNRQIEKIIQAKIEEGAIFSVAYYDIDNFKCFNDKYGYRKGDSVIRHTAYIISNTVKKHGNKSDFVGHIGGDDFVVVTTPKRERLIASESILDFSRLTSFHYSADDRDRGHIVAKDRRGNVVEMPLMSVSVAIANNSEFKLQNIVELMEIITEIKRHLKTLPGSNFLVNRRKQVKKEFIPIEESPGKSVRKEFTAEIKFNYRPLGQILLESQILDIHQLEMALDKHWSTGQRIGQSIIDLGYASSGDIVRALESQLNIPHYDIRSLDKDEKLEGYAKNIPARLIKERNIIPINQEKNVISVVMLNPKDIEAINEIKNFTGCNVAPFFVLESEFNEIYKRVIKKADKGQ